MDTFRLCWGFLWLCLMVPVSLLHSFCELVLEGMQRVAEWRS